MRKDWNMCTRLSSVDLIHVTLFLRVPVLLVIRKGFHAMGYGIVAFRSDLPMHT